MDRAWWRVHHEEVAREFKGRLISIAPRCFGAERVRFKHGGNSGAGAVSLAAHFGARRIILLGYDCKYGANGARHWHGDHPAELRNATSLPKWRGQFSEIAGHLVGVEVVNATRDTALTVWPRVSLEEALA